MKRLDTFILLFLMSFYFSQISFAVDLPGSRYIPVQAQGMGNAYLPLAEDNPSALFYQPSAIAKKRKKTLDMFNIQLESNPAMYDATSGSLNVSKMEIEKNSGNFPFVGAQAAFGFGISGFSIGGIYKQHLSATRDQDDIIYKSKYLLIPAAGFGLSLADGLLRMGYVLQWVHQKSTNRKTAYTSSGLAFSDGLDQGSALSHNFGMTLTFPLQYTPSIDVVVRNIGKAKFQPLSLVPAGNSYSGNTPEADAMSMDASFSLQPKIYKNSKLFFVTQLQDVNNRSGTSFMRRLAIGTQWEFGPYLRFRAGVSEGYPTLGFGIDRTHSHFDLSWYSVERGNLFRQDRDIRFALQIRIGIE